MQRDMADLVRMDLEGLVDQSLALFLVGLDLDQIGQLGHPLVAIATQIEGAGALSTEEDRT